MKRKPTSYGDMLKSVATVQHPDLKPHHRVLLSAIALWCGETGEHSRPTNKFLQEALGVGKSRVDEVLAEVVALGIVKCTHRGRGEGNASVYRICLEHPAFQDAYKCFKPKPPKVNAHHVEGDSLAVTPTEGPVNAHPEESYRPPETDLTPTTWWAPSYALSTPTPTPKEVATTGECVKTQQGAAMKSPETLVDELVTKVSLGEEEPITPSKSEKAEMLQRAREDPAKFVAAGNAFIKKHKWNSKTTNPFSDFVSGYAGYAAMKIVAENAKTREDKQAKEGAATDLWYYVRVPVGSYGSAIPLDADFLTEEDKAYLEQIKAAKCVSDFPPNARERSIDLNERYRQWMQQAGADDLFDDPREKPSQPTEAVEEEVSKI